MDREQLQLHLNGIIRLADIRAAELRERTVWATPMIVTAGQRADGAFVVREFPIYYRVQGNQRLIGVLRVEATLVALYRELMTTALVILVTQAAITFLVSIFIIVMFHRLVTRHLTDMANLLSHYDIHHPPPPVHLSRITREGGDELDQVVSAFNDMCAGLQQAYLDLNKANADLRRLVDSNIIGIVLWEADGKITKANDAFLGMVGYSREELLSGKVHWREMTPPEYRDIDTQALTEIQTRGSCRPFEKEYIRKDGSRVPVVLGGAALEGEPDRGAAFVLDIRERKQAEQRQKLLLYELNHRVKNTLATVTAIAAQTLRTSETPAAFREAFEARLLALSATHNLLNEASWEGASLRDVVSLELAPYVGDAGGRVTLTGSDAHLGPRAVVILGMAFHELATNSAKYGALSVPNGEVRVAWDADASRQRLHLEWQECGGPPVQMPRRKGFGSRLLERGLARELAGGVRLDFMPTGVHCVMDLPLDRMSVP